MGHLGGYVKQQMRSPRAWWLESTRAEKTSQVFVVLAFATPVVAYFVFLSLLGVNAVKEDQWSDIVLAEKALSGHLNFGDLWAQHNENRLLFPNLVVLLLTYTTHLNTHVEEYLSALLLVSSVALVVRAHRRRSPGTPWLWYCPVVFLMLSWVQEENTLWGFQLAWYLVIFCLAAVLNILDRERLSGAALVCAIALALVGSYSSLQGLLIWMVGLTLLAYRRRSLRHVGAWVAAGIVTTAVYLIGLNASALSSYRIDPWQHPIFAIKLYLFLVGNVAGKPLPVHLSPLQLGAADPWILVLGGMIIVAGFLAVVLAGFRGASLGAEPLGIALILFSFAFAVLTVIGRGLYGYVSVSSSRYTTYTILASVGAYLVLISRPVRNGFQEGASVTNHARPVVAAKQAPRLATHPVVLRAFLVLVLACVALQLVFGYANGLSVGRFDHSYQVSDARIERNYRTAGAQIVYIYAPSLSVLQAAQRDHLCLFNP